MAEIIPLLNKLTLSRMTSGEKKVARCLQSLLEDDCLCWYDIPIGKKRRYPDFIILHPARGLLFLEVKDWKPRTLKTINKTEVKLLTDKGLVTKAHPLDQARQYTYPVIDMLSRDPQLQQKNGRYKGSLLVPYGWGVVFTQISRQQIEKAIPNDSREILLPDHLIIYKDNLSENGNAEVFQQCLWGMFDYQFGDKLSVPQIDRVRWYLFPEVRIGDKQTDLFVKTDNESLTSPVQLSDNLPETIKIMDIKQEQLARSLGEGHRIIHGVAGSGKTLILCYRCLQLAQTSSKPILVLCFNISLAAKLRSFISAKDIDGQVQVYHFHSWCKKQLSTYHVALIESESGYWVRQVDSVITAVDKGLIPRAQYSALLIDEGHDFEAEWLTLVVQMIDADSGSLLLLYDDLQSIYKKHSGLGFSLSSVGIQAKGRTTVLELNYRNTREILNFAYEFVRHYIDPHSTDDDYIPLIEPQVAGTHGDVPEVHKFENFNSEVIYTLSCLQKWHEQGVSWKDMAVLCIAKFQGSAMTKQLKQANVPYLWMGTRQSKAAYDDTVDKVTLLTVHSSKGLEFPNVVIIGMGTLSNDEDKLQSNASLLYVGMTRAQKNLLLTTSGDNVLSNRLYESVNKKLMVSRTAVNTHSR